MGESSFDQTSGIWSGTVIVERGGFTGIRTRPVESPLDLTDCSGFRLKIKGQGQRFKFLIRDNDQFNGIAWSASFDTNPWFDTEVKIKFSDFKPTRYAQVSASSPTLNTA